MTHATIFRAPRMDATSGAWLEALSKREAQTLLVVLPWFVFVVSALGSLCLIIVQHRFPEVNVKMALSGSHLMCAVLCSLYLLFALSYEPISSCVYGRNACRRREGWFALVPVVMCLASSVLLWASPIPSESLSMAHFKFIDGPISIRVAATFEFSLQLAWLAAAEYFRYEGRSFPSWKAWSWRCIIAMWLVTFVDPLNEAVSSVHTPKILVRYETIIGYSTRVCVFAYCVAHTSKSFMRYCCEGIPIADWQNLDTLPCTPGRQRLRYLGYYLLTRPGFLLVTNLPLGYPLAIGAAFASTMRCFFALLLALLFGPAPREAFDQHSLESDTRERFNVPLAMRLCEYCNETYNGAPPPRVVTVSGSTVPFLDGEYEREFRGNETAGSPIYVRSFQSENGLFSCGHDDNKLNTDRGTSEPITKLYLRRTPQAEWEISRSSSYDPGVRHAYVCDTATSPDQISGGWVECGDAGDIPNLAILIKASESGLLVKRRFAYCGQCDQTDAFWTLVEEEKMPNDVSKFGHIESSDFALTSMDQSPAPASTNSPDMVSIIVAFRGTSSTRNLLTDARIAMRPLTQQASWSNAEFLDVDKFAAKLLHVESQLRPSVRSRTPSNSSTTRENSFSRDPISSPPDLGQELTRSPSHDPWDRQHTPEPWDTPRNSEVPASLTRDCIFLRCQNFCRSLSWPLWCLLRFLFLPFWCLLRVGLLVFCPFVTPSDLDEDDEDFGEALLEKMRIHVGFTDIYSAIRSELMTLVRERMALAASEHREVKVFATGHSLGGALATLFALDFVTSVLPTSDLLDTTSAVEDYPIVYTFGSPRVGNPAFRSAYNTLVPETFRLVASRDIVPSLPPSVSYRQVGREVWLDDAGELTFIMSWAMRQILPARDNVRHHVMVSYYYRLSKAFYRTTKQKFRSVYQREAFMKGAFDDA